MAPLQGPACFQRRVSPGGKTSIWPFSTRCGPGWAQVKLPIRFGISGIGATARNGRPRSRRNDCRYSAPARVSPGGFAVATCTNPCSRRTSASSASAMSRSRSSAMWFIVSSRSRHRLARARLHGSRPRGVPAARRRGRARRARSRRRPARSAGGSGSPRRSRALRQRAASAAARTCTASVAPVMPRTTCPMCRVAWRRCEAPRPVRRNGKRPVGRPAPQAAV